MAGPLTPSIWYEALATEAGVIVQCSDPGLARQKLYAMRKELNDPELDCISVQESPTNPANDLWLVKRKNETQSPVPAPEGDAEPSAG